MKHGCKLEVGLTVVFGYEILQKTTLCVFDCLSTVKPWEKKKLVLTKPFMKGDFMCTALM